MSCEVTTTPITLILKAGVNETIARKTIELLKRQAEAGIAGSGGRLGTKKDGSAVTLGVSGDLWREVKIVEVNGEASVEFEVPYADPVFKKYDALRLSPAYETQLAASVGPAIEAGVTMAEEP